MAAHEGELQTGELETMLIPGDGFAIKQAFSMDIGGSMTKIVYAMEEGSSVRLHFVSYPRAQTKDALVLLGNKMGGRQPDGTTMDVCGVGFQEYADYLQNDLNVHVKVNEEINCFTEAFRHMAELVPLKELVHQDPPGFKEIIPQIAAPIAGGVNSLSGDGEHWELAPEEEEEENVQYPVLLCMLGSGGGSMKMEADGTFKVCEAYTRCGRMLLALANLMVDAKSFTELIELASQGDASELHVTAKHMLSGAGDVYDQVPGEFMVYSFGQAMSRDKDSFKREDIAAALVSMVTQDLAQSCHLTAMAHNIKSVYLCGSVVGTSQYLRTQMNQTLAVRGILNSLTKKYNGYFLRFAGYYGALGALMRTLKNNNNAK